MPDGSNPEVHSENYSVSRYSYREEDPEEPYFDFEEDGFLQFKELMQRLREKYPEREFKDDELLNRMRTRAEENKHLATYIGSVDEEAAGGIIGYDRGYAFDGLWFVMDPKYQNSELTKKLLGAVKNDFDEVTLLASTFGFPKDIDVERRGQRQQALVRYYEKLGFTINTASEAYKPNASAIYPVPMIWRRQRNVEL